MSDPRLPPELCDYVLDYLAPPYISESIDGKEIYTELSALATSARVCRSWLPRARIHLYSQIDIRDSNTVFSLALTLAQQPTLANWLRQINAIGELSGHDYFPFLRLLPSAPRLERLTLYFLNFDRNYPASYIIRLGCCTSVATLSLNFFTITSLADLLRLIRSFLNLTSLETSYLKFERETSASTIAELQAQRASWAPPLLRKLEINGPGGSGPTGGGLLQLLGEEIEELNLETSFSSYPGQYSPGCLAGFNHLRAFKYSAIHGTSLLPLLDFPGEVRSPMLHSLHLAFRLVPNEISDTHVAPGDASQSQPVTKGLSRTTYKYQKTRGALLDEVFSGEFHDILVGMPSFPALVDFAFLVQEISSAHDEAWWGKQVEARLPGVPPGVVRVSFPRNYGNPQDDYDHLWEPDSAPAAQPALSIQSSEQ